jgi:hypothetical protein
MIKKMFTRSSKPRSSNRGDIIRLPVQKNDSRVEKSLLNETVAQESMNKARRQLFQFDLPTTDLGFQDLIRSYEEGNRFQYVALTGSTDETYESRIRKVLTFNIANNKKGLPQFKVPMVKLINMNHQFNLGQLLNQRKDIQEYIRLSSVIGVYTPLISSFYEFSTVSFTLHDTRKISRTAVQTAKYNSNLQNKVEMSLDCCVPRTSADKIILDIGLEQATLKSGEQWGVLQLVISMETSDIPYVTNMKEVVSVVGMPPSLLETYKSNPNYIDTTITEAQKKTVRDMYESGDIADETEPMKEELKPVTYARSSIGLKKKGPKSGKEFGVGWSHLNEARKPLEKYDDASIDPEGSDDVKINTEEALKNLKMKGLAIPSSSESSSDDEIVRPPPKPMVMKGVKFNELQV